MAKTEETNKEEETWGTWEELLLACAVKRHGTRNWDSVAMEIQNRSSSPHLLLTPHNCKQKYLDLHRRFKAKDDRIVAGVDDKSQTDHHHHQKRDDKMMIPWLDELRKLRVAELRREVQRSDVSIVSLQLKVKKLKEEREQSLKETESSDVKPDLAGEDEKQVRDSDEPERSSPGTDVAGKPASGDESDRENQSFNESNSTDLKGENRDAGPEKKPEPVETPAGEPDPVFAGSPVEKTVGGEGSYNGSSDTIAKGSLAKKSSETVPARETRDSAELWESVAESKGGAGGAGGEEGTKESSDVQSSASLSRKNRRRKVVSGGGGGGGNSSGEDRETDEVSPAIERVSIKSQPLADFLEMIQSHKYGSVFESRLESQETTEYNSLIRQHIDLETVQTRFKEGHYSGCQRKFFRDLLLLFNNAIVFYPKNSNESVAARELRQLVSKELSSTSRSSSQSAQEQVAQQTTSEQQTAPPPLPAIPKVEPEPSDSLLPKPKPAVPIIACRKRSSISAKASAAEKKAAVQKETPVEEEKPVVVGQKENDVVEEEAAPKKRKGERPVSGTRSSRSNKNRNNAKNLNTNQNPSPNLKASSSGKGNAPAATNATATANVNNSDENSEVKAEEKKNNSNATTTVGKKRSGVANFLNRMKRNSSSSSNGTLLETLKSSPVNNSNNKESKGSGSAEQKKTGGRREQKTRQSSAKQTQEQSSPAKRSVGRPPKRAPPAAATTKRSRETPAVETTEAAAPARQPRKRTRR